MYGPLNLKTENSLLTSMIKIDDLITYAKKHNIQVLTISDTTMYGAIEFYTKCKKNNIKPIIGLEINTTNSFVLYAKNYKGYKNLLKINTSVSDKTINDEILKKYSNDLICIVEMNYYEKYKHIYKDVFIGYKDLDNKHEKGIYFREILCLEKNSEKYLKYLNGIKDGKLLEQINNNYEKSSIEEYTVFDNYEYIINNCNLEMDFKKDLLPVYDECIDAYNNLKKLCIEGLKEKFGNHVYQVYMDRLKYELDIINKMGFCDYFLIVWDYVLYARKSGILVGPGRGSAAGSLVAYLLNITTVDPIKYNLIFERFLNPSRITMPDIDIDFEYTRREEVINYCINKYGIKKVVPIITFGTMGSKQVIRDVARVMDIDIKNVDRLCKFIDSKFSLKENYNKNVELKDYLNNNDTYKQLYKISQKLEGLKRHTSIHAAGVVMCKYDIDEIIPLEKNHESFYTTGFSMEYLEDLGLLKMDLLALKNLTLINDCLKDINISFDEIPLNDQKAIQIFTNVDTIGIFQFESQGMMNFLRKFKPSTFEDVVAAIALFRPGPMENIDTYIKRRKGKEIFTYYHDDLKKVLEPTFGIIVYQEQIMQIASILAGYTYAEADLLRRAMSKKNEDILLNEKSKFLRKALEKNYEESIIIKVYDMILKFANYGFNRAHAVCYAMIAYKMAYLKHYYSTFFIKHLLAMVIGSEIKTKEYVYECRLHNINIIKPNINISTNEYIIIDNAILFPLTVIKNVGVSTFEKIIHERKSGLFKDIFDFVNRVNINKKSMEYLIISGCFDSFNINKQVLIENMEAIINYSEIGGLLEDSADLKPRLLEYPEYTNHELMNMELVAFGFYISNHPVTEYKLKHENIINLSELNNYFDTFVETIVYIDRLKQINTKKESTMCFITGSDELMNVDIVLFPKVYDNYYNLECGNIIKIYGKVEKRFDKIQIIASEILILDK